MHRPFVLAAAYLALLLAGSCLHFTLVLSANMTPGFEWWLEYPPWGIYAAEYIVFATWLAWGLPPPLCRAAAVSALGISWMLASWAGLWVANPEFFAYSGAERLRVFTLAPLALLLGTLPLAVMRRWFRFVAPSSSPSGNNSANIVSIVTLVCVGAVIIAAHRFRGPDLRWDILIAALIAIVLGAIAAATAPLLAWGFLGREVRPLQILLACLAPTLLAALASLCFGAPGPGAAGVVHATPEAAVAAIVTTVCLCVSFWCWRFRGIRLAPTRKAEPSDGADLRQGPAV